jgi:hypothetical protein
VSKIDNLPSFRPGLRVAKVPSLLRESPKEGGLPPLMEDVRNNHLAVAEAEGVLIYLKSVAAPYTGEHGAHFLVIPDANDKRDIPGIKDLELTDLGRVLQIAESVAFHTLQQEGIDEVDFGLHHSRAEFIGIPKQRIATFPVNLHIHINGYSEEDMVEVSKEDALKDSDIRGKTGEALYKILEQIVTSEVTGPLSNERLEFNRIFEEIKDERGRVRFKMKRGRIDFSNESFPVILQSIDEKAKKAYDDLARCFFEYDAEKDTFVEGDNEYKRFKLLDTNERIRRINEYIEERLWLSEGAKFSLRFLSGAAVPEDDVVKRELDKEQRKKGSVISGMEHEMILKRTADRFWAFKDLAYTMVWSARKQESGDIEWIFAFDPKVFTVEGIPQSSAFTDKLIVRDPGNSYSDEQLNRIRERELRIVDSVLSEP